MDEAPFEHAIVIKHCDILSKKFFRKMFPSQPNCLNDLPVTSGKSTQIFTAFSDSSAFGFVIQRLRLSSNLFYHNYYHYKFNVLITTAYSLRRYAISYNPKSVLFNVFNSLRYQIIELNLSVSLYIYK